MRLADLMGAQHCRLLLRKRAFTRRTFAERKATISIFRCVRISAMSLYNQKFERFGGHEARPK